MKTKSRDAAVTRNGTESRTKISLPHVRFEEISVKIIGTADLLTERFSDEDFEGAFGHKTAKGQAKLPKAPPADPTTQMRRSVHLMPGETWEEGKPPRIGHPSLAFKLAMTEAANDAGQKRAQVVRHFDIIPDESDLTEIKYTEMKHDCRPGHTPNGRWVPRHRVRLAGWSAVLKINYNATVISRDEIVFLIQMAGFGVGIGGYRKKGRTGAPGIFGTFRVADKDD